MGAPSIDAASIASAKAAASRTGVPQPVKDTSGKTVYYVDEVGAVVPAAVAQDRIAHSPAGQAKTRQDRINDGTINPKTGALNDPAEAARQRAGIASAADTKASADAAAAAIKNQAARVAHGYVWVNGQLQLVNLDAQGRPIVTYQGGGLQTTDANGKTTSDPKTPNTVQGAFSKLPTSTQDALGNGNGIFNLSTGPADIFSGRSLSGDGFGTPGPTYGPGDHSASANTVSNAKNQLTVAEGVQWFLNLSVQHPDQYKHLLDMLHASKYLTDGQYASAAGGYSSDAAGQFALAAIDLAQVNTTPGGANLGLYDFLNQKAQAGQAAASAVAQPVTRAYQDPATLAYAARNAAQSVLGRNLTPAEEKAFEAQFHGKEDAYYNDVDAANQAQASAGAANTRGPANTAAQPDTTGEAAQYVQGDQFANQRNGYSMLEYLKAFQTMLGGGKL